MMNDDDVQTKNYQAPNIIYVNKSQNLQKIYFILCKKSL